MSATAFQRMRRRIAELKREKELDLAKLNFNDLRLLAKDMEIPNYGTLNKKQLIDAILSANKGIDTKKIAKQTEQSIE